MFSSLTELYGRSLSAGPGTFQQHKEANAGATGQDTIPEPQVADSLYLDEILIQSTRINEPSRYQPVDVQIIDSLRLATYQSMPVSAVLSRYSSLFIRDNGPGGLATLSQRGLSPGQTQVLWEGFPLNSLSLGLADLSVIPGGLFNSVEVSPGTPSSTFGGGSLGGTVYLTSSSPDQRNRLAFIQSAGAFDTWNTQFQGNYGDDRWTLGIRSMYQQAENDFSYYNRARDRQENRTHNANRSGHLMGTVSYQLPASRLYSSFWYYNSQDEIPGSILTSNPQAEQSNRGFRWIGGMELPSNPWEFDARTFLERDHFGYEDPSADIDSRFTRERWMTHLDFKRPSLGPLIWKGGISGGVERVRTTNYAGDRQRWLLGLRLNPQIRIFDERLRLTPTARADVYTDFGWVWSPSLGVNWEVLQHRLHLRGMVSRDFNPPSFNDLYWVPSGNPDLNPEQSFKTEAGIVYSPGIPFFDSFSLTAYRIWLEEGIYWFPDREGVWTPSNVEEVDAYGVEARFEFNWQIQPAEFHWTLGADWRKSEMAAERFPGDQAVGLQMRYVPEGSFRSGLSIRMNPLLLHLNYRWTDLRYTTSDHTSSLDDYQLLDATIAYQKDFLGTNWHVR
ncbi:MAG: TonB-dependent receptor, partial [Balneolaceae bacterium]